MKKGYMPTIKKGVIKEESSNIQEEEKDDTIDNKLELLQYISKVQSAISKEISSDFILAKLGDKDKTGITEMVSTAYYAKKIISTYGKKKKKYEWDNEKQVWTKKHLDKDEQLLINRIAEATFDSYMTRVYMTAILNRNVSKNYLVRLIAGFDENEEESKEATTPNKIEELQSKMRQKLGLEEAEQ